MSYLTNYDVTQCGQVLRVRDSLVLRGQVSRIGYKEIILSHEGKRKCFGVHRLVAQAFIPNPDNLPEVNHIDGDKLNNDVSNLAWSTHSANVQHAYDNRLYTNKGASRSGTTIAEHPNHTR